MSTHTRFSGCNRWRHTTSCNYAKCSRMAKHDL